jgi:hypothetical protein
LISIDFGTSSDPKKSKNPFQMTQKSYKKHIYSKRKTNEIENDQWATKHLETMRFVAIVDDVDDYYDPNPCRRFIQGAEGESGYPGGSV